MWYSSRKKVKSPYEEIESQTPTPPVKTKTVLGVPEQDWDMTPETLAEVLQEYDLRPYAAYLKKYKDAQGRDAIEVIEQEGIDLSDEKLNYLNTLLYSF